LGSGSALGNTANSTYLTSALRNALAGLASPLGLLLGQHLLVLFD
jgi:hypothetical protein